MDLQVDRAGSECASLAHVPIATTAALLVSLKVPNMICRAAVTPGPCLMLGLTFG